MSHKADKRRRAWKKALKRALHTSRNDDNTYETLRSVLRDVKRGEIRFVGDIREVLGEPLASTVVERL